MESLVGAPLKNMISSVGMIIPNVWKNMFQTTYQLLMVSNEGLDS